MELEFDKEMDAILRRARDGRGVLVGDNPPEKTKHIDADSVAAFVENALPAKTRTLYMEHFADCGRCRRILSHSMLFAAEADEKDASVVSAPVVEVAIPWYQKLFRTPNLAITMGALVLAFGGFFAFTVIQDRQSADTNIAQVTDGEKQKGGPFASDESSNKAAAAANANSASIMTNTAANVALPAPDAVPNPMATPGEPPVENRRGITLNKPDGTAAGDFPDSGVVSRDEAKSAEEVRPAAKGAPVPPPAPIMLGGAISERESKKELDDRLKDKNDSTADSTVMRKQAEAPRSRDLPPSPSKSGPVRSGPLNTQTSPMQNQVYDMPVSRTVGGKTFNNRNGAWYDSSYKNEATMNFRRGTDAYKKLDSGLRSIADNLGGTVVLVWKGKAYRIQ